MPTKETFLQLSTVQQMVLVMEKGYALLVRKENPLNIKLFELNGFYVEVKYHFIENKIVSIELVNLEDVTDDYLADIQIDNLF
ncbi:MAG: hypothetical protein DRI74_09220 [Bacteroidetes bacterium]|nr:MAG: hypothetical protein DRI74_09220 [Bacteroidota bacterium]